eukprot:m.341807 g.341807  ORF g.341807 m.341807 type:complete len:309 (-) comp55773_c1_seq12:70-996(-)
MWSIVVHGGAGLERQSVLPYAESEYTAALEAALAAARACLLQGGDAVAAAAAAVVVLEDAPVFNAGHGSVLNTHAQVEMDAAIMDGLKGKCGACSGVRLVRNPVLAAREIMLHTPHCFLAGPSVDDFARQQGLELMPNEYFVTAKRLSQLKHIQAASTKGEHSADQTPPAVVSEGVKGTVGAVVRDAAGNLAAASSTGGKCDKWVGRVGDTPCIGAGIFANQQVAVACTGDGEAFIRRAVAAEVAFRVQFLQLTIDEAVSQTLAGLAIGDGGIIAVGQDGLTSMQFNTDGMFRGVLTSSMEAPHTGIW